MKKLFLSLLAVAALASCSKTESAYVDQDQEIKLAPVASMITKAEKGAIDGTQYPENEKFDVYAYWKNEGAGSSFTEGVTNYLGDPNAGYGVEFVKKGDWFWGGTTPYYWPKNGSLRFAAYSPADLKHEVKHDVANDTYTVLGYTQPYNTAETFDFLLAPTSVSYTSATAVDDVDVVFEHALSWITLQAKAKDDVAANAFTVTDVIINDVNTVADLTAAMPEKTWSKWATPQKYVIRSAAERNITVTVEPQLLDVNAKGTVIIPQATTTVTVKYTQNALKDKDGNITSPKLENQEITVPLLLDGNNTPWEPGKHYIYTLIFGLDEILITPAVADWEDVNVPVVDVTATEVSNAEELISAVAAGRNVRLTNDINITEPVVVSKGNVLVELNGKTISSTVDGFEVKGGTLNINGPGAVKASSENKEPFCAVWAYGDAVVNIYGGQFEIGYPEGDYNDLIYAKENAKINIYGGKFLNSGSDNSFVLNLKDTDRATAAITVYGGTYEKFNPANNASEGANTNFVAPGYNVVSSGDYYTVYAPAGASVALAENTVVYGSFNISNGTLEGNGKTITVPETITDNGLIRPAGNVTIQNVTLDGKNSKWGDKGIRNIFIEKGGNYVFDNIISINNTYAISTSTTENATLKVTNSVLEGWTSYDPCVTADFANVSFKIGTSQKTYRPHGNTVLTGCSFEDGFIILLDKLKGTIVFDNCTYGGQPLTAANLKEAPATGVTIR